MGYNTYFGGEINVEPKLSNDMKDFLERFSNTRRMKRDSSKIAELNNGEGLKYCFNNEPGIEGENYAYPGDDYGQTEDISVLNGNDPSETQPSLWCGFIPNEDGSAIVWNEDEKTYEGAKWISYIVKHFLAPSGYICNGRLDASGEYSDDLWAIEVENNEVFYIEKDIVDGKKQKL